MSTKNLIERIESDETWKWARGDENRGVLQTNLALLEGKVHQSKFVKYFLAMELKTVKKNYKDEYTGLIKSLAQDINGPLQLLEKTAVDLNAMHAAKPKVK
eukprot:2621008-Pyramimonas_sp.AAC.1